MKRTILVFGSIAGLIVATVMLISVGLGSCSDNYSGGMIIGYASMLIAFSFVFIGIKNFRDKHNNNTITFGKAFTIGILIALIASTFYVVAWLIDYYCFIPDFMDKYSEHMIEEAKNSGKTAAEIEQQIKEMNSMKEMYKNPLFVILITYCEILPVGLLVTLVSAAILRKKAVVEM